MAALLEIKNIETYYDLIYALRGVSLRGGGRHDHRHPGKQRGRKIHDPENRHGADRGPARQGDDRVPGRRIDGRDTEDIVRMGLSYVPEGREVFNELTVRENLLMGAYIRRDRRRSSRTSNGSTSTSRS